MPNRIHSSVFCLVIALAMTFGMLRPVGYSASHDPVALAAATIERQVEAAAQIENHDHANDDGVADEQSAGHFHGHNAADHSHETASTPADFAPTVPQIERGWLKYQPTFVDPDTTFRLDRPPRPFLAA
ncbi:hypothetical protein NKH69_08520 [Mesorhizobium sp. M0976]|uniref:hypothetical protein n=2 Tax=unclassified Mesorhizobium TaxID=325217 RepID=UPI00333B17A6